MKKHALSLTMALALAACSSSSAAAPLPTADSQQTSEQLLRDSVQRLATAWNAGDGNRWAAEYWADGSLINILGVIFPNAQAVAAVTNQILAGPFKGSTFAPVVRRIRFIGANAAVVESDVSVTNFVALPPGAIATKPGLLLTRLTDVFENRNGVWKIEASQNTSVLPSASAPPPS